MSGYREVSKSVGIRGALKPVTGQEQEHNFRMQLEVNNTCR